MGVAHKCLFGVVVIIALLVSWQVIGLGRRVEALANQTVPPGEVREALDSRLLERVSLKTGQPNLWIHLGTRKFLPHSAGTQFPVAAFDTTKIDEVPAIEQLCAYSVMYHNSRDFNVIMVSDDDLPRLLPGWSVNLEAVPEAARALVRKIAMLRVVYYYGGMLVPSTFAATAPFSQVLSTPSKLPGDVILAFDAPATGVDQGGMFAPSAQFLYSTALNPTVQALVDRLSVKTGTEAQTSAFHDLISEDMSQLEKEGKVRALPGGLVGTRDADGKAVSLAESIEGFTRDSKSVGVWIPERVFEIRKYGWLMKETPSKILAGSTWLAAQVRKGAV